jgi:hypothetical protein
MTTIPQTKLCPFCKSDIDASAGYCRHCGKAQPGQITFGKVLLFVIAVSAGLFALLVIVEAFQGPRTYKEIAEEETQRCIRADGYGGWVGSSGVSLQTYCELYGTTKALEQKKQEHPEEF